MIKNRMVELAQISGRQKLGSKLNTPLLSAPPADLQIKVKFAEAERVIAQIDSRTQEIIKMKQTYKKLTDQKKENQISNRLDLLVKQNTQDIGNLKAILELISKETETYKENDKAAEEYKTSMMIYQNLLERTKKCISDSKDAQYEFQNTAKDKIKRHTKIIKGEMTEAEIEQIMANPEKGQQLLQQRLFNVPSVQLENAVSDIEDKYRDIQKLQRNMEDCLKLMQDLAVLVQYQGQLLNNIELSLTDGKNYVEDAEKKLIKAKEHHKESRKKMICIILCLLALIAIIVVPIVLTKI